MLWGFFLFTTKKLLMHLTANKYELLSENSFSIA